MLFIIFTLHELIELLKFVPLGKKGLLSLSFRIFGILLSGVYHFGIGVLCLVCVTDVFWFCCCCSAVSVFFLLHPTNAEVVGQQGSKAEEHWRVFFLHIFVTFEFTIDETMMGYVHCCDIVAIV